MSPMIAISAQHHQPVFFLPGPAVSGFTFFGQTKNVLKFSRLAKLSSLRNDGIVSHLFERIEEMFFLRAFRSNHVGSSQTANQVLRMNDGTDVQSQEQPPIFSNVLSSQVPIQRQVNENSFGSVEEIYIPLKVAKKKVSEVEADMAAMKAEHIEIIKQLEIHYKEMEKDMQEYFLDYIAKIRKATEIREKQHQVEISKIKAGAAVFAELGERTFVETKDMIDTQTENVKLLENELDIITQEKNRLQERLYQSSQLSNHLIEELNANYHISQEIFVAFNALMQFSASLTDRNKDLDSRLQEQSVSNSSLKAMLQSDSLNQVQALESMMESINNLDSSSTIICEKLGQLNKRFCVKLELIDKLKSEQSEVRDAAITMAENLSLAGDIADGLALICADADSRSRTMSEKVNKLESEMRDLTIVNDALKSTCSNLESEIAALTSNLSSTGQELNTEISNVKKHLTDLELLYSEKCEQMFMDVSNFERILENLTMVTNSKLSELLAQVSEQQLAFSKTEVECENLKAERAALISQLENLNVEREMLQETVSQNSVQISETREQIDQFLHDKTVLEEENSRVSAEKLAAFARIEELQVASAGLSAEMEKWQSEVSRLNDRLSTLQVECQTAAADLARLRLTESQLKSEQMETAALSKDLLVLTTQCVQDAGGLGDEISALLEEAAQNTAPQGSTQYVNQQVIYFFPSRTDSGVKG